MKILRITLSNLASLSGTHTVDFTRDPLRSAGLFAISGVTGAGKSTLLDALCLALYDATPRLQQVGLLVELDSGTKQNDPRTLLRRGAASGFAEVAFVGVDGQSWTARWSVHRSRRRSEGAVQKVEMVLYRGHIPPGGQGEPEEAGRKTAVLARIVEKVGLTFEQFTRAVLLAQNDFATFLKAADKERAEILQALTGTEQFEVISRAVFARCNQEKQAIQQLEARQQGEVPLDEAARAAAEARCHSAEQELQQTESQLQERQKQAAWFQQLTELKEAQTAANDRHAQATARCAAATPRRQELELTELVSREARSLRNAVSDAATALADAEQAQQQALQGLKQATAEQSAAAADCRLAEQARAEALTEQERSQPLLDRARELDATLPPLEARCTKARDDVASADAAVQTATARLNTATTSRSELAQQQQTLQAEQQRLAAYAPYVPDTALWLERIDTAVTARSGLDSQRDALQNLTRQLAKQDERMQSAQSIAREHEAAFQQADNALQAAVAAEQQFNAEQLSERRAELNSTERALTRLAAQLQEVQSLRQQAAEAARAVQQLSQAQTTDAEQLQQLQLHVVPQNRLAVDVAREQLEFIQAAVDDHAQRLRITLQDGRECPVCGSTSHPYRDQPPDIEATAVQAAKKSVRERERALSEAEVQLAGLQATMKGRSEQTADRQRELQDIENRLAAITLESAEQSAVAAVLARPEEERLAAAQAELETVQQALSSLSTAEQQYHQAVTFTARCRNALDTSRDALAQQQQVLNTLRSDRSLLAEKRQNASDAVQLAETRWLECTQRLSQLWSGWPTAQTEFEASADRFRDAFAAATSECSRLERQIAELSAELRQADAAIPPLQEALVNAQNTLTARAAELQQAEQERDQQLHARAQLFAGQAVDSVLKTIQQRLQSTAQALQQATDRKIQADQQQALQHADAAQKSQVLAQTQAALQAARQTLENWLAALQHRTSRTLSLPELDQLLNRNAAWIAEERRALEQLDQDVAAADGTAQVHARQLQQHLAVRPTQDDEAAVLNALGPLQEACQQAKATADQARAILLSDDQRREANRTLQAQLRLRQEQAEPWLKLNDLIGSADGAKFRMIAQRRTLDLLLQYANFQLHQLASRYRLERLPESLNLIVIDRDMGDERRSIHSLSGGESFLVSLALALGLASLTSNRLRIESLFIDEGFGSLDPETLNTAMGALMQLEAQGRKVGVISHVTEMTDAIPVQIRVVKGRGGASRIEIPGAAADQSGG